MRLWSINPKYLDPMGLVALWRESLLAQKVLLGQTRGYQFHPQLARFRMSPDPVLYIGWYLTGIVDEADRRGYRFDRTKIARPGQCTATAARMPVQRGQIDYEWEHLLRKLKARAPDVYQAHQALARPQSHPLFRIVSGGIEDWERP